MKLKKILLIIAATLGMTAVSMAQNVPNYVPTNGLVGWWPFNGNANDESGNGNTGIPMNGVALTADRFGNVNKAYSFDGVDDWINIPSNPNFDNLNGITLSAWINIVSWCVPNMNGVEFFPMIVQYSPPPLTLYGNFGIQLTKSNSNYFYFNSNNYDFNQSDPNYWQFNQWINLIVTAENNIGKWYLNGINIGTLNGVNFGNSLSALNLMIGRQTQDVNSLFSNGKIDDIGIWNRALTQEEITNLYNAPNCSNNLIISPASNLLQIGNNANFTATTSDSNPSYNWQSDFGQGFQTLNNIGNYSGSNTATLNIANVQLSEHNQTIRVITTSGNCIDTSNVAIISITDTCINTITDTTFIAVTDTLVINTTITSLNPPNNANTIKVFPNPTNDHITIDYGNFSVMNGYQLKIENSLGQQVFQTNITQQSDYLNLTTWGGNGLYFVHIIDPQGNTIDIRKIVLQ